MKKRLSHVRCPSCQKALTPKVMGCDECDVEIRAHFQMNEFNRLSEEQLHFLRIFILTEGKIQAMERSLGISYPKVKSLLGQLKRGLGLEMLSDSEGPNSKEKKTQAVMELLDQLESGDISAKDVVDEIKKQ